MSVERNPLDDGIGPETKTTTSPARGRFPTRYDLLLFLLPLPLLLGVVGAKLLSLPAAFGAGVGGLPSALLLGYGLFVASPTETVTATAEAGASAEK